MGVASNFATAAAEVAERFTASTGHAVRFTTGSTGKLYAQILNGAPLDLLLAADSERPRLLVDGGQGIPETRLVYAVGQLVLWSRSPGITDCRAALGQQHVLHIAIANPETAPYGAAARAFLVREGLWDAVQPQLVTGENVAQALQFTVSGNATIGFVAGSQLLSTSLPPATCEWPVPASAHPPIEQQAIQLRRSTANPAARQFLSFLRSDEGRGIIERHGYRLPELTH